MQAEILALDQLAVDSFFAQMRKNNSIAVALRVIKEETVHYITRGIHTLLFQHEPSGFWNHDLMD
jgi:hypothetical protein